MMVSYYTNDLCCYKNYQRKFDKKNQRKVFDNTCKLSKHDLNKFVWLFSKGIYTYEYNTYEYASDWEKFYETSSPEQEDLYRHLDMLDNTDEDYTHA